MTSPPLASGQPNDRAVVATALDALCAWAEQAAAGPLPDEVLAKATLVLIDNLAATCAAHAEPEIRALSRGMRGGRAEATFLQPGGPRTDRQSAAFVNGVAGCWCELDEGYRGAPCHAALYVLPALLVEAEAADTMLGDVLGRSAVAYEVVARLAETWRFPAATIHPHAAFGGLGAAVGAALARGATKTVLAEAIRIAGGLVPAGTYQAAVEGALVRNLWTGQGAVTGMNAVDWAEAELSGFPDGPNPAFSNLLNATLAANGLVDRLGERWAILGCYHKLHGCCHSTHSAVEAALALRRQWAPARTPADITRIEVATHRPTMSNPAPVNTLAARFSFEHVVAASLVFGHAEPEAFSRRAIDDATVARLRDLVRLMPYDPLPPWPQDRPARLAVAFSDGTALETTCLSAPGGPDQPLSADAVLAKAERLTRGAFPGFAREAAAMLRGEASRERSWRATIAGLTGSA